MSGLLPAFGNESVLAMKVLWRRANRIDGAGAISRPPFVGPDRARLGQFCDCLKYRKSGGACFLRTGIRNPSPLMK